MVGLSISMILFSLANTIQADSISNSNTTRQTIHLNSMNNLGMLLLFMIKNTASIVMKIQIPIKLLHFERNIEVIII
ncbi:hypothetical protein ABE47_03360 [Bacillus thuringiensis]|uniref:Secreted protein n=1 Tax=Bacillus thuringiensis YBT-1518 TaxID=529122 RepID=A0A9W3KLA8_BACTU|nr:hypothetical protein YBT1518_33277 [Bacillus thuringiensis YBT-1518]MBG9486871.1 hypothetical protein [Bacillus thuringiensis]AHA75802.1 hypothetical protein YBT1518_31630 [Bacillus thuringiensis YBT-1518]MBG9493398.1 hypothetical protein [Bacillus thuringiensis]MBG9501292.1 hypothetical protein [Bacillus thuringiensis]